MHNEIALLVKMIKHLVYFALHLTSLICSENTPVVYIHVHIGLELMMDANTMSLIIMIPKALSELG